MKQMQPSINSDIPLQRICYGAPGTGKSHDTDDLIKKYNVANFRTTFHPDSDYATFVGAYKPTMNAGKIEYSFRVFFSSAGVHECIRQGVATDGKSF